MIIKYVAMSLVVAAGVATIVGSRHDVPGATSPFVLAYMDRDWRLRIRYSDDGTSWLSANAGTPIIQRGPGLATDENQLVYLTVFDDDDAKARMMVGLGHAAWDTQPSTIGGGYHTEIKSGTSIAHIAGSAWLVGYVSQTRAKIVNFSTSTKDFGAEVTPVPSVVNTNLIDKPAIAIRYPRIVVSWLMDNQLQIVTGDIDVVTPNWQPGYLFSANVTELGFGPPIGAHDLVHDGNKFYLAVVRHQIPPGGYDPSAFSHYFMFIYTSDDGLQWTKLTYRETMNPHAMSIAARDTNDIIAILSRSSVSPTDAYHFNGASWSNLDEDLIFGANWNMPGRDFTLFADD